MVVESAASRRVRELTRQWNLEPAGEPVNTPSSTILRVQFRGREAVLKVSSIPEEQTGMRVLDWWNGNGCARVDERASDAILMDAIAGPRRLTQIAESGGDDLATTTLCDVIRRLHETVPDTPPPPVPPLETWFRALTELPNPEPGLIIAGQQLARELLASTNQTRILHGDIHHENVLDGGERGWLAIDPKGLNGDPIFDYVNILRNPLGRLPTAPGRFRRQVDVIVDCVGVDRSRLLAWSLAFSCLSATWIRADCAEPVLDLQIAALAAAELGIHATG